MQMKTKVGIILFVLAVAIIGSGALYAYFTDSQKAAGNIFTSEQLLLTVGTMPTASQHIMVGADGTLKPGAAGTAANWEVKNIGNINGDLSIGIGSIANSENGVNNAELNLVPADTVATGELGAFLKVAFWMDTGNNGWSAGDYYLNSAGAKVPFAAGQTALPAAAFDYLNNYDSDVFSNIQTSLPAGTIGFFKAQYDLPWLETTNAVQSDTATFDITFTLSQTP
jgi:predicted ribosomally synthesized peptide with SipW-like signal peptide